MIKKMYIIRETKKVLFGRKLKFLHKFVCMNFFVAIVSPGIAESQ